MAYPAVLELHSDTNIANWRPLVHWLLAIPHLVIANVLSNVGNLVAFFAVLATGTYPAGLRDFMVRTGRFFVRLTAYGYLLTDEYPPLALD
jgi:hypothetical protein